MRSTSTIGSLSCGSMKQDAPYMFVLQDETHFNKSTVLFQQVIGNEDFNLADEFKTSFILDIVKGLGYLHETARICHGQLNLHSCIVTPQWTVRISNYGLTNVIAEAVNSKLIKPQQLNQHGE